MKIGIFGDVHGNLPALEKVLECLKDAECDALLCTGDIVGYGPFPKECIETLRENNIPSVRGNHDHYVAQPDFDWQINPNALEVIRWTASQISEEEKKWLSKLPLCFEFNGIHIVHASFAHPEEWTYVINRDSIEENFKYQEANVAFNGHSHIPLHIEKEDDEPAELSFLQSGILLEEKKHLINVGSVGQPRDIDNRASCVIYDTEERTIRLRRLIYDRNKTIKMMKKYGLPKRLIARLELGK
ncbi:MAG: metallophosphoesterase family protein [Verrucomicrobiota bacterium]|nr:metallophosphoesterase family protein [Verrucomicrobiota bacterium]